MAGGKSDDQVIEQFNEYVNMTVKELEDWLETEDSQGAGWGGEGGETVGHQRCASDRESCGLRPSPGMLTLHACPIS